jgi:hypothetical protein
LLDFRHRAPASAVTFGRADRIAESLDVLDPPGHGLDARLRQLEPVEQGRRESFGRRLAQVLLVGGQDLVAPGAQRRRRGLQGAILLVGVRRGQHQRGGPGVAADGAHEVGHRIRRGGGVGNRV